jgi:CHASE2 domain-containing sensor protein
VTERRWAVAVFVAVAAVAGGVGLLVQSAGDGVEHATIDWRYALRGDRPVPSALAIVAIDAKTGSQLNVRLPPSRDQQARVVRRLARAGARVIAYDLALNGVTEPDDDEALVRALREARSAVVSVTRYDVLGQPDLLAGIVPFAGTHVRPGITLRLHHRHGTWITFTPPQGGLDSFALAAAAAARHVPGIPLPPAALIDYHGPAGTVPRLSFVDVLHGHFDPAAVRDKVIVVGDTAPELQDQHDVPIGGRMAGPELQANAIATALDGFPLRIVSAGARTWTVLGLGVAQPLFLIALLLMRRRRRRWIPGSLPVLGIGAALTIAWTATAQLAFDLGTVVAFVPGLAAVLTATTLTWVGAQLAERQQHRELRRRFAEGDDDQLVDRVMASAPGDGDYGPLKELITGFTLEARIGSGGMGAVYRAQELSLERPVALKVIRNSLAEIDRYRARFLDEAKRAACIEHPNVVPVYSVGQDGEQLYIVMRLIEGTDLGVTLREHGPLELGEASRLMHRIALALDALRERGVVHCDVKPANILRSDDDPEHPYLTDFGIARALGGSGSSGTGRVVGTPAYIAPEQIRDDVGPAADIYALGAVLFHCVTGTVPFPLDDPDDVLYAHTTAPRPKASDRVPALPAQLDGLIQRSMAIDPADRFTTAVEFTQAVLDLVRSVQTERATAEGATTPSPVPTQPL